MIRVLIADDELYFRNYMLTAVDWHSLGFQVCYLAQNGEEVLSALSENTINIIFLDINMPHIDGISLAEKIRKEYPDIMIVFITGYSDFSFTRKAIQLQVEDYMLKPISPDEFTDLLHTLGEKFKQRQKEIIRKKKLRNFTLDNYMYSLLSFSKELSESYDSAKYLFEQWKVSDIYQIAVVEFNYISCEDLNKLNLSLLKFSVKNCLDELINSTVNYYSFQDIYNNNIIYLFNFQTQQKAENFSFDFMKTAQTLIKKWFSADLAFGIGTLATDLNHIADSYQKALLSLQYKILQTGPIYYSNNNNHTFPQKFSGLDIYNRFLMALRQTSLENIKCVLLEVEEQILLQNFDICSAQLILSPLFSIILSFLSEKGININDVLDNDPILYPNIFLNCSIHDSCNLLFNICQKVILLCDNSKPSRASEIIHLVQDYIQRHYMDEELSVKQISENVVLDASYIRKVFNKYLKCTITDYILSIRMEHARRLLEQGNTNITEVSSLVGYKDSGYFSKVFKKYYGISPKLYK